MWGFTLRLTPLRQDRVEEETQYSAHYLASRSVTRHHFDCVELSYRTTTLQCHSRILSVTLLQWQGKWGTNAEVTQTGWGLDIFPLRSLHSGQKWHGTPYPVMGGQVRQKWLSEVAGTESSDVLKSPPRCLHQCSLVIGFSQREWGCASAWTVTIGLGSGAVWDISQTHRLLGWAEKESCLRVCRKSLVWKYTRIYFKKKSFFLLHWFSGVWKVSPHLSCFLFLSFLVFLFSLLFHAQSFLVLLSSNFPLLLNRIL